MSDENKKSNYRLAHTMIRVLDLDKSIHFYCDILGMQVLRKTDYPGGRYTNTFIGYGPEAEFPTLELTHNWDQEGHYDKGNGWGHLCIETPDVHQAFEALTAQGAEIISPPGPMSHGTRILAFLKDPDGYVVELNETINLK
ncbi:MAG: lactoylglutathione lyase [Gammaproteobacteria bacterium]